MQAAVLDKQATFTVLVTGANSGLGFATCCRLMDEFLFARPQSQNLHLVVTTRDQRKSDDTLKRLRAHLATTLRDANGKTGGISTLLAPRIRLEGELLDLCSLVSVKALAQRLLGRVQRVDVLILNAGVGGWRGLDWPKAIWAVLTDWVHATTYPTYKLGYTGNVTKSQIVGCDGEQGKEQGQEQEPVLGETFTANVFGHYMLAHYLVPVMTSTDALEPGRIVWVSSLEAYAHSLSLEDIQGLKTDASYESSKRLTDLLVLTSELPSTQPFVSRYLSSDTKSAHQEAQAQAQAAEPPKMYLSHPGICGTSIANLNPILDLLMFLAFHVSRLLGSPWHTVSAYLGACSMVWLALSPRADLEHFEIAPPTRTSSTGYSKKGKWGSSADVFGNERVMLTEVEGWGWSGRVGETNDGKMRRSVGRWRGMTLLTKERREEFEEHGKKVWSEMEELREEWERRLANVRGSEPM